MSDSLGPSPGAVRHPTHKIEIATNEGRWIARLGDVVIADSQETLALDESGFERVVYFPPQDVDLNTLVHSESETTCPFKGRASYFAADIDGRLIDVAWYYPEAYDEVSAIAGYVAFYADRIQVRLAAAND